MEVELAGDKDTWTPLLDGRTGHPLVRETRIYEAAAEPNLLYPSRKAAVFFSA